MTHVKSCQVVVLLWHTSRVKLMKMAWHFLKYFAVKEDSIRHHMLLVYSAFWLPVTVLGGALFTDAKDMLADRA